MMTTSCKFALKGATTPFKMENKKENPFRLVKNREKTDDFTKQMEEMQRKIAMLQKENADLKKKAFRDARTKLYNAQFFEELKQENNPYRFILFLDIDDLKGWNSRLGHMKTDYIIECLAKRFQSLVRSEEDYCIRYAGDEFVLVFHIENDRYEKIEEIHNRLTKELTEEGVNVAFKDLYGNVELEVTAYMSIGEAFSMYAHNNNSEEAVKEAVHLASMSCLQQKNVNKKMRNQHVPHLS